MHYEVPDVPGFAELWGGAVFHCPFRHGWDVIDRRVAVHADGDDAAHLQGLIAGSTNDVVVVEPAGVTGVRVEAGELKALLLEDGAEVRGDAVLVRAPLRSRSSLREQLGLELTDLGLVGVDAHAHTSVPGVYTAGDLAVAPQQAAIAMGSGHLAGIVATRELLLGR